MTAPSEVAECSGFESLLRFLFYVNYTHTGIVFLLIMFLYLSGCISCALSPFLSSSLRGGVKKVIPLAWLLLRGREVGHLKGLISPVSLVRVQPAATIRRNRDVKPVSKVKCHTPLSRCPPPLGFGSFWLGTRKWYDEKVFSRKRTFDACYLKTEVGLCARYNST